jgi:tricorn protease
MTRSCLTVLITLCLAATAAALEAPLPRHPAPSPDGALIAFSWQGDIWTVPSSGGTARRMTAHPATERFPVWSRDGKLIAFSSNRFGHADVFVMPADGSAPPTRLTFADRSDTPVDFTPDGTSVVFSSGRSVSVRWMPALWTVPLSGGTPVITQNALGDHAAYSPNGTSLAFVRGATKWVRHGYRGTASRTPWLRDTDGAYRRLSAFDGDEDHPGWVDDHTLMLLSSRSQRKNVFLLDTITGEARQLTHHEGTDVRFPRVSADGSLIAYEFEDALWTIRPNDTQPRKLSIDVPADHLRDQIVRETKADDAKDLAVHPDGELAAFIVEGDLFIAEISDKDDQKIAPPRTIRITDTPEREAEPRWSPDGNTLLFTSATSGTNDLWTVRPSDEEVGWIDSFDFKLDRLTTDAAEDTAGRWSPDGASIAFVRGKGNLMIMDSDGDNERTLFEHWAESDFRWSPDGRFLAYSTVDAHYNAEVWIVPAAGGEAYNVSRHPDDDLQPRWSPDGRRLLWVSKRHADTFDVWGVWLTLEDHQRTNAEWLKVFNEKDANETKEDTDEGEVQDENNVEEPPEVQIDFKRLWRRAARITGETGDESDPVATKDGKRILFTATPDGKNDLYSVSFDGKDLKRLTEGDTSPSDVQLGEDGTTVFYLDGKGRAGRVSLDGTKGDPMPFAARVTIDVPARRKAVFNEAWRALNGWFYDPAFHGANWPSKAEIYRPWAMKASSEADFADVVNLMLGELNASHMGYRPKRSKGGEKCGWIGVTFDPAAGGPGVRIDEVLEDGPAAQTTVNLKPGERLLAIDRHEVTPTTNVYALFVDTVDRRTPLRILGTDGVERTAVVVPTTGRDQSNLRYQTWVRQRQDLTEQYSGGRLGYLHIHSMDIPSFETFERDLQAAAEGKEGLVIDVRSNGGGWTTDYLLATLMVRRHAFTVPRDDTSGVKAYPQSRLPLAAWTRPAVTICNEDSYSNAEIFSHAFKTLKRGPLVGQTTFGAVISTGAHVLPDGSYVRIPLRGWYVAGSGMNMENNGAVPDVILPQPPYEDTDHTVDTQLKKAVETLLAEMPTDKRTGAW